MLRPKRSQVQPEDGRLHIYPLGDWREHEMTPDCWCHPKFDDDAWVHHALDQRERCQRRGKLDA